MQTYKTTTHDNLDLSYYVAGAGDDVLMIANVPGLNLRFWFPLMEILSDRFRLIGFEYRGFPENTQLLSPEQLSFDNILRDVETILSAQNVESVHWLSWCAGGLLARAFTERYPDRTLSLVDLSSPLGASPKDAILPTAPFYVRLSEIRELVERSPAIAERICLMMRELGDVPSAEFFETLRPDDPELQPVLQMVDLLESESSHSNLTFHQIDTPIGLRNYLNLTHSFENYRGDLQAWLKKPLLLLNGENDGFLGRPFVGELGWPISLSEIRVPDASHFLVMERPEVVAGHIATWLAGGQHEVRPYRPYADETFETINKDNFLQWSVEAKYQITEFIEGWMRDAAIPPAVQKPLGRLMDRYLDPGTTSVGCDALLTYHAISGRWRPAIPIAAICSMIWAAAHCFDDLCDDDLGREWDTQHRTAEVTISSFVFSSILPPLLFKDLNLSAASYAQLQELLSRGLLQLLNGQLQDLHATGDTTQTPTEVAQGVMQREPWGFFMQFAAVFAGASTEVAQGYQVFGDYYGLLGSLHKDYYELFLDPAHRDLNNGTYTLYLATCMDIMAPEERVTFDALLQTARHDPAAQEAVRRQLRRLRFLRALQQASNDYTARALAGLQAAAPPPDLELLFQQWLERPTGDMDTV